MANSNIPPLGPPDGSSEFLLQPLPAPHHYDGSERIDDTDGSIIDIGSIENRRKSIHSQPDSLRSPTRTGLLIKEVTPTSVKPGKEKQAGPRGNSNALAAWGLELAVLLIAAGLLVAIIFILKPYNQEVVPNWGDNKITLNALVAVLATIFRASLAFVVVEIIGQLKWEWITTQFRPMQDLNLFDSGSRGIYGSIRLLPLIALHEPLAIGAILVAIISLAIGPITQQTIQNFACQRPTNRPATISAAAQFAITNTKLHEGDESGEYSLQIGIQTAMQDALVNPSSDSNIGSLFSCPSGNCTFASYGGSPGDLKDKRISHSSVGICSRCVDVYDLIEGPFRDESNHSVYILPVPETDLDLSERFPLNLTFNRETESTILSLRETGNLSWADKGIPTDFINQARWSFANFSILVASQFPCDSNSDGTIATCPRGTEGKEVTASNHTTWAWDNPVDFAAATCIMYACNKYYAASITNGALFETEVGHTPLRLPFPQDMWSAGSEKGLQNDDWMGVKYPCEIDKMHYTASNISSSSERLGPNKTMTIQDYEQNWEQKDLDSPIGYTNLTVPVECIASVPHSLGLAVRGEITTSFDAYCPVHWFSGGVVECVTHGGDRTSRHVTAFIEEHNATFDTIRKRIDSMAMRITTEMRLANETKLIGQALENRTCLQMTWGWLALPAATLATCAVLLAWIIVRDTQNGLIWKNSMLPLLLRDHPGLERMNLGDLDEVSKQFKMKIQKE